MWMSARLTTAGVTKSAGVPTTVVDEHAVTAPKDGPIMAMQAVMVSVV